MLRLHIVRNRQTLGEFTPTEVAEGLQTGKFLPTDLGWREPMDAWMPLGELENLPTIAPAVPPPLSDAPPPVTVVQTSEPLEAEPAWERRKEMGWVRAMTETVRQIFIVPITTFRDMKQVGGFRAPLLFFVIISTLCGWVASGYDMATIMVNPSSITKTFGSAITPNMMIASNVAAIVLTPVVVVGKAFAFAGLFHLVLLAAGWAKKSFEVTFRAYCYAAGAASVMLLIPFCGRLVAIAMTVWFVILAIREAHRMETWRAVVAVGPVVLASFAILVGLYAIAFAAYGLK